jgi:hypothetical protein
MGAGRLARHQLVAGVPELAHAHHLHIEATAASAHHAAHHALGHTPVSGDALHAGGDLGAMGEGDGQLVHLLEATGASRSLGAGVLGSLGSAGHGRLRVTRAGYLRTLAAQTPDNHPRCYLSAERLNDVDPRA